tara:strand:+ start:587 stop:721 length:135 start_codon:yes stop_codon:yes gene_type:complete
MEKKSRGHLSGWGDRDGPLQQQPQRITHAKQAIQDAGKERRKPV